MDQSTGSMVQLVITTVIIVIAFYFILIRPQSQKQKEEENMRKNLEIGDEITTIGGIVGRVVSINDDTETMVIETGADRTKIKLKKWALSSVNTRKTAIRKRKKTLRIRKVKKTKRKNKFLLHISKRFSPGLKLWENFFIFYIKYRLTNRKKHSIIILLNDCSIIIGRD